MLDQDMATLQQRLQHMSAQSEHKDSNIMGMRQTIELLRKQAIEAGLTSAHIQSMSKDHSTNHSIDSTPSSNYGILTVSSASPDAAASVTNPPINRHHSSDSMCSLNSLSSRCSAQDKKKKTGWLRTSFRKAFTRNPKMMKPTNATLEEVPSMQSLSLAAAQGNQVTASPTTSPTKVKPLRMMPFIENAEPVDAIDGEKNQIVEDLKKQLREKELVLTDTRLEALNSASQLESLKDTVSKMHQEMMSLKQKNEQLKLKLVSKSLAGSEVSLGNGPGSPNGSESRRYSLADGSMRTVSTIFPTHSL